jgi:phosphotransferase system  glucose/maltose/N-acetylglucosamine-specific IIC component
MNPADYFNTSMVRRAVVIPTMVCLWYLVRLWWHGELYGTKLRAFVLWFVAALATQFASHTTWVWIAGFLGQVALAITLVLKQQRDDFL